MPDSIKRWLLPALMGVFLLFIVGTRAVATARLAETDPSAATREITTALVVILSAVVGVAIYLAVLSRIRTEQRAVIARAQPEAIMLDAYRTADTNSGLRLLKADRGFKAPLSLTLAAEATGLTIWGGGADAKPIVHFAWDDVLGFTVGTVRADNGMANHGLVARVRGAGREATIPFQVLGRGFLGMRLLTRDALLERVEQIATLAGKRAQTPGASVATSTLRRRKVTLIPGWSALRLARAAIVVRALGFLFTLTIPLTLVVLGLKRSDSMPPQLYPVIVAILLLLPVVWGIALLLKRAQARETAAGYTTLIGGDLNLAHVDDTTGTVLREAGEPLLTREQLKAERERARLYP